MIPWIAPILLIVAVETPSPGPTVAREDTLSTEVAPILVRAPRVTLSEILDRVARGEARRDSLIQDQSFRVTMRLLRRAGSGEHVPFIENVYEVYRKRPGHERTIPLREWRERPKKDKGQESGGGIDFDSGFNEEIVNFAFQPSARRDFTYRIAGRDLIGNHLIYRIAFQPRSFLNPGEPSGVVWVDTNDFVIVRQEVSFDRSPIPAIMKGVDRMVVERQRSGDLWVLKRVLMRAELTFPIPRYGRVFDFALLFDDYRTNQGIPDSVFAGTRAKPAGLE